MTTHVEVRNLVKKFGDLVATDDVSFSLEEGEFVSVLGPSGSGKTTILRMIGGFESPTEGAIYLSGEEITDSAPFDRDINTVFQSLALFPHLTVKENIAYGLKQSDESYTKDERADLVAEMLDLVDLAGYQDRNTDQLSGGEQQRVALARALVNKPKLLLLDEPLASLDRKLRQQMQVELKELQKSTGITFLYVTHDQDVALSISDRMIILNDGEIEQIGSVEDLYNEPKTAFVANFLGDINRFPASIETDEATDQPAVSFGGNRYPVESAKTNEFATSAGDAVDVCVRPHDVEIQDGHPGTSNGWVSVPGTVRTRTFKGDSYTYTLETDAGEVVSENVKRELNEGDEVYLCWEEGEMYVFPPERTKGVN